MSLDVKCYADRAGTERWAGDGGDFWIWEGFLGKGLLDNYLEEGGK